MDTLILQLIYTQIEDIVPTLSNLVIYISIIYQNDLSLISLENHSIISSGIGGFSSIAYPVIPTGLLSDLQEFTQVAYLMVTV